MHVTISSVPYSGYLLLMCITEIYQTPDNQSKVLSFVSFSKMIAKIVANFGAVKDWFGFNYTDINNLLDLFKILCLGQYSGIK